MRFGHELVLALVWVVSVGCSGKVGDTASGNVAGASGIGTGGLAGGATAGGSSSAGRGGTTGGGGAGGSGVTASGGSGGRTGASGAGGAAGTSSVGGGGSGASGVGASGTGGAAGSGVLSAQFKPVADAFCAAARTCCTKEGADAMLTDCESVYAGRQPALVSVDQGTVKVDSTALASCLTAYRQAATACDENTLISACQGVFVGTRNENEPCTNSYECKRDQGPMSCLFVDNQTLGTCKKVPHGKSGDACVYSCRTGDDCSSQTYGLADSNLTLCFEGDGVYCDTFSDTGPVCKPIVSAGGACESSDACGTLGTCYTTCQPSGVLHGACGLGCRHDLTCTAGTCEDPSFDVGSICEGYAPAP